jgi:hypothetical protein
VLFSFARLLRLASVVICLIAIASFVLFVVNQTSTASTRQQEVLNGPTTAATANPQTTRSSNSAPHKSAMRRAIDDASNALTSPFSGVTAGSTSQWVIRGANLLLALIVYGFGLGFIARVIRVRV